MRNYNKRLAEQAVNRLPRCLATVAYALHPLVFGAQGNVPAKHLRKSKGVVQGHWKG